MDKYNSNTKIIKKYTLQKKALLWYYVSDELLGNTIQNILRETQNAGEVYVLGSLRSRGMQLSTCRMRERLQTLDTIGKACKRRTISRTIYRDTGIYAKFLINLNVRVIRLLFYSSLIDSNHKLVTFRYMYHEDINGYTRTIT